MGNNPLSSYSLLNKKPNGTRGIPSLKSFVRSALKIPKSIQTGVIALSCTPELYDNLVLKL